MFFGVRLKEGLNEVMCLVLLTYNFNCLLLKFPLFKCWKVFVKPQYLEKSVIKSLLNFGPVLKRDRRSS